MMLQKSPLSSRQLRTTMLKTGFLAMVLLSGAIYLQSCTQQHPTPPEQSSNGKTNKPDAAAMMAEAEKQSKQLPGSENYDGTAYTYAQKMPEPTIDLSKYLGENIKYPEVAVKNKVEGRIIVKFIVDESGNVIKPAVIVSNRSGSTNKDVTEPAAAAAASKAMEAEALRVVANMPKWKPGEKDGKKVSVYFNLPILFKLK